MRILESRSSKTYTATLALGASLFRCKYWTFGLHKLSRNFGLSETRYFSNCALLFVALIPVLLSACAPVAGCNPYSPETTAYVQVDGKGIRILEKDEKSRFVSRPAQDAVSGLHESRYPDEAYVVSPPDLSQAQHHSPRNYLIKLNRVTSIPLGAGVVEYADHSVVIRKVKNKLLADYTDGRVASKDVAEADFVTANDLNPGTLILHHDRGVEVLDTGLHTLARGPGDKAEIVFETGGTFVVLSHSPETLKIGDSQSLSVMATTDSVFFINAGDDGKLVVVEGRCDSSKNRLTVVDPLHPPSTLSWRELGTGGYNATLAGRLLVFGGKCDSGARAVARVYDEHTGTECSGIDLEPTTYTIRLRKRTHAP